MTVTSIKLDSAVEHAQKLFEAMMTRKRVWVDSPANQPITIESIHIDGGVLVVYDSDGNDHPASDILLAPRERTVTVTLTESQARDAHEVLGRGSSWSTSPPVLRDIYKALGKALES